MKFIYLISLPYSGSTVISLLANAHPDLVSPGEMFGPRGGPRNDRDPVCSCGELISNCSFWNGVGERYIKDDFPWVSNYWGIDYEQEVSGYASLIKPLMARCDVRGSSLPVLERLPFLGRQLKKIHARNNRFAQAILDEADSSVILDASKSYARFSLLNRLPDIDMYALHLIRDPRGWCNSRKKNSAVPVEDGANFWVKQHDIIEQVTLSIPNNKKLRIRYEDFCSNPQETLASIFNLVDLPQCNLPDDFNAISHHLLGNRMRTKRDIQVKEDLSWKEQLAKGEIELIEKKVGKVARRYGYAFS